MPQTHNHSEKNCEIRAVISYFSGKPTRSVIMSVSSSDTEFEDIQKPCIWCRSYNKLAQGKKYCIKCSQNCFRECKRCHRPFDDQKYFQKDANRCNSCQTTYLKEKEKRQMKRQNANKDNEEAAAKQAKSGTEGKQDLPFEIPEHMKLGKMAYIPIFFK